MMCVHYLPSVRVSRADSGVRHAGRDGGGCRERIRESCNTALFLVRSFHMVSVLNLDREPDPLRCRTCRPVTALPFISTYWSRREFGMLQAFNESG